MFNARQQQSARERLLRLPGISRPNQTIMKRLTLRAQALGIGLFLSACGSVSQQQPLLPRLSVDTVRVEAAAGRTTDSVSTERTAGYVGYEFTLRAFASNEGKTTFDHPTIKSVRAGSPADGAGLRVGDMILEVNGKDSRQEGALFPELGVRMVIRVRRAGAEIETSLIPVPRTQAPRW